MRLATQQSFYRIIVLILFFWAVQWCLVVFGGNTAANSGNSLFIATLTYQEIFHAVPDDISSGRIRSLYYDLGAISARIFGSSYHAYMIPNLIAFLGLILGAFFFGRRLAGLKGATAGAAFAAMAPPVAGFSENYESPILEMALVLYFLFFFYTWLEDRKKSQYIAAFAAAFFAVWSGTTYTYQALALVHIALFMFVFCIRTSYLQIKEGATARQWAKPWIGAFVIGAFCSIFYLYLVKWGAELGYHISEVQRFFRPKRP